MTVVVVESSSDFDPVANGFPLCSTSMSNGRRSIVKTSASRAEIEGFISKWSLRAAIGAAEIWEKFPELRGDFIGLIRRHGVRAPSDRYRPLGRAVRGDILLSNVLCIVSLDTSDDGCSNEFSYGDIFENFPILNEELSKLYLEVSNSVIFLVDGITITKEACDFLPSWLKFLTPREVYERTDLPGRFSEHDRLAAFQPFQIPEMSGAFFIQDSDMGRAELDLSLLSRFLAGVAAFSGISVNVVAELRFFENGHSYAPRMYEHWHMPFRDTSVDEMILDSSHVNFWNICKSIEKRDLESFNSAREDYRALSLETAADSRYSRVPALQYVQIWMAVERLLPFRHETSLQLTLALGALFPAVERIAISNRLKSLYDLRSRIAHGYDFKRSGKIQDDISFVSNIYRKLLRSSILYDDVRMFRNALVSHVISGVGAPIDKF